MEIIIAIGIMAWLLWTYLGWLAEKRIDPRCIYCGRRHQPRPVPPPEPFDPHEDLIRQINKAWAETHPVPPSSPVMLPVLQPGESLETLRTADGRIVRYVVVRD